MNRSAPAKPVVIDGEEIKRCPGCSCLVIWEDKTARCVHCQTPLAANQPEVAQEVSGP
jgi:hypothetical protein